MRSRSTLATALVAALALTCGAGSQQREDPAAPMAAEQPRDGTLIVAVPAPEREPPAAAAAPLTPVLEGTMDWAQFHGDGQRRGASSAPALEHPALSWRAEVGIQGWLNSPLVVGGTVLVPSSGRAHNAPDPGDGLVAIDRRSGRRLWFAHLGGDANGAAADKTRAYVSSDDGHLRAIELETGKVLWQQPGKGKVYAHPLLVGGQVVVGDAGGYLRAFDAETGTPRWAVQLSGAIRGGASADERTIYAVSETGELAALSLDGKLVYRKVLKRPPWDGKGPDEPVQAYSPPIVAGPALIVPFARDTYYTDRPALLAVARKNGTSQWMARGPGEWGNVRSTPALVGDLLVYAEPYSGDVVAVSSTNGRVVYRRTVGSCYFPQWSSPAAASDVVYVMRFDGVIHALRATDGKSLWRFYVGDSKRAGSEVPPELDGGGACEWGVPTGHPAYSPLAVAGDGTLLAGTHEGYLYAIGDAKRSP